MGTGLAPDERLGFSKRVEDSENVYKTDALPEHADSRRRMDESNPAAGFANGRVGADQLATAGGITVWNVGAIEDESFHSGAKQVSHVFAQSQQ